jgi:hypothetical protein
MIVTYGPVGNRIGGWNIIDEQNMTVRLIHASISVLLLLVAPLLPQLPLSKPKKENRRPKEENQKL